MLQELANTLTKKFGFSYPEALSAINESDKNNIVHINTRDSIALVCKIADRYHYSFYDSLIIAAALEFDCSILYSEDLNNGQIIEKKLTIVNPFL